MYSSFRRRETRRRFSLEWPPPVEVPASLVWWTLPWPPTVLSYEVEVGFASFFGNFPGVAFVLGPDGLGQLGWFP